MIAKVALRVVFAVAMMLQTEMLLPVIYSKPLSEFIDQEKNNVHKERNKSQRPLEYVGDGIHTNSSVSDCLCIRRGFLGGGKDEIEDFEDVKFDER